MVLIMFRPSFVNVLMVYAFCNLHDVSWGTKGDSTPTIQIDEAPVIVKEEVKGTYKVTSTFPDDQAEIDKLYDSYIVKAMPELEVKSEKKEMAQEDYFKLFRTRLVLFWVFTNAALIVAMTFTVSEANGEGCLTDRTLVVVKENGVVINLYLAIILWSVCGLV
jgi:chitin synthase